MIYWRKQGAGIFATACVETEFDPSLIYSSLIMIYYYIDVFFWDHPSLNYFCAHVYSFFFFFSGRCFHSFLFSIPRAMMTLDPTLFFAKNG